MSRAWSACLDALEAHLRDQLDAVGAGRLDDVVAFTPAAGLGPLPPSLADRAQAVAVGLTRLTDDLAKRTAAHARQLQVVSALHPVQARASYLDARG